MEIRKVTREDIEVGDPTETVVSAGGHIGHKISYFATQPPVIDVRDYGAVGDTTDGTDGTDDTAAFQAALDAGYNVGVPDGDYKISTLSISRDYTRLFAIGKKATLWSTATSGSVITIGHATMINHAEVNGLNIRVGDDAVNGITTTRPYWVKIWNCNIQRRTSTTSTAYGIEADGDLGSGNYGYFLDVQDNWIQGFERQIYIHDQVTGWLVRNNSIYGNTPINPLTYGIYIAETQSNGGTVDRNIISNLAVGVWTDGQGTKITGNRFEGIDNVAIQLASSTTADYFIAGNSYSATLPEYIDFANSPRGISLDPIPSGEYRFGRFSSAGTGTPLLNIITGDAGGGGIEWTNYGYSLSPYAFITNVGAGHVSRFNETLTQVRLEIDGKIGGVAIGSSYPSSHYGTKFFSDNTLIGQIGGSTSVEGGSAGRFWFTSPTAPASAAAAGKAGEIRWDSTYLYWCYSDNNWRRVAYDNTW